MAADAKRDGNEHFRAGDFARAYECYARAIEHDALDAVLYCNRAMACTRLDRPADALEDARVAIKLRPVWAKAHFRAAEALEKVENMAAAAAFYSEALRLDPTDRLVAERLAAARCASSYPGEETVARTNRHPAHSIAMDGLEGLCDQSRRHLQRWADDPTTAPRVTSTLVAVPVSERDRLFTDLIERLHELKLMQPASERARAHTPPCQRLSPVHAYHTYLDNIAYLRRALRISSAASSLPCTC
jgi:tetratricopeptide (TPR) repeat protein